MTRAEPLYLRALAIREQALGSDHPDTALSLNNLALLYDSQGKSWPKPLYVRALKICEQQLGPEHPNTASSLNNLAMLYHAQEQYERAEPLYQRAIAIWQTEYWGHCITIQRKVSTIWQGCIITRASIVRRSPYTNVPLLSVSKHWVMSILTRHKASTIWHCSIEHKASTNKPKLC